MSKADDLALNYDFNNPELLAEALTHSSYANEAGCGGTHNERLEFLGDAVLELCVSQKLFRLFPEAREGELTHMRARLVSQPALADLSRKFGIEKHLRLGRGEEIQGGRNRDALISDAFEAVLGAIYFDGGFDAAQDAVEFFFAGRWPEQRPEAGNKDYKSLLQELTQKKFQSRPVYTLTGSHGPEHSKVFEVSITLPDDRVFTASAGSVKRAEQAVAGLALKALSE